MRSGHLYRHLIKNSANMEVHQHILKNRKGLFHMKCNQEIRYKDLAQTQRYGKVLRS